MCRKKLPSDYPPLNCTADDPDKDTRFRFIKAHRHEYSISAMCRVLGVSRNGYHAWVKRPALSRWQRADVELAPKIREIHEASGKLYGAPRIQKTLKARGIQAGQPRIIRLMKQMGLRGSSKRTPISD